MRSNKLKEKKASKISKITCDKGENFPKKSKVKGGIRQIKKGIKNAEINQTN
ncbi:hypothetical protein TOT_020000501 [Theileria orientalis strain Shintoku]|uniref:Uncharacterized protein n=1 Tax=Theileria orientalis strain Shintoku TaxID=869250 RepID=J4D7K6_THEOR|nr:hypothetical protein TOT_020000501 [Theileria orientalis strain Shintoku]BAM40240.1 hypothetical protein TOT_020000501 [Theileria orientalis strain Shintoku]|eukprot:XP_009690541.1 hypothetical protein TOT_020000501 [Theileria orientalis strain Shintoku]